MKNYIAVVGNAPLRYDAATEIDNAKLVIRFNLPHHAPEEAGTQTDIMFIGNGGNALRKWLRQGAFESSSYFSSARRIIFPRHPDNIKTLHPRQQLKKYLTGKKKHYTQQGILTFTRMGKEVSVLPPEFSLECYRDLGLTTNAKSHLMPSTGFIGIKYALGLPGRHQIKLYGFTWQGWSGHPWDTEFQWLSDCHRITITR